MIVYLAGPMHGLSRETAAAWRETVDLELSLFGIQCLTPVRDFDHLPSFDSHRTPVAWNDFPQALTARDRFDVKRSDLVLMNLIGATRVSVGTTGEAFWADAFGKPLIVCAEPQGNPHDHPIIRAIAATWLPSIEDGIKVVKSFFSL